MYVFIDSKVKFACSFYSNYKFSVAQKNVLEIVLPRPQVPSATVFLSVR
jgi:hypothetical protein